MVHENNIDTLRRYHGAEFLICNSCFWCASILSDNTYSEKCPACKSLRLESTPISEREAYSINTVNENLSIEFWNLPK
jgi:hypothetical protein